MNKWLSWKMHHGLAARGRVAGFRAQPRGLIAKALYVIYYQRREKNVMPSQYDDLPNGGRLYKVRLEGGVAPKGKIN